MEASGGEEDVATTGWHGVGETEREEGIGVGRRRAQDDALGEVKELTGEEIN